jgi:hypothetical protein
MDNTAEVTFAFQLKNPRSPLPSHFSYRLTLSERLLVLFQCPGMPCYEAQAAESHCILRPLNKKHCEQPYNTCYVDLLYFKAV